MLNAEHQNSRVRAFSVGSRAKVPRSDYLYRNVLLPSQISVLNANEQQQQNNNNNNNINNRGKKSSSAPILNVKGHNSIDPMDDLMEIDYSRKDDDDERLFSSTPVKQSLPVPVPNTISMNSSYKNMNVSPKAVSGRYSEYVEMKPQQTNSNDSMSQLSQSKEEDGYLNMRPVGLTNLSKSPSLSSSPIKTFTSPKTVPLTSSSFGSSLNKSNDYMDMSSRSLDKIQNLINDDKPKNQKITTTPTSTTGSDDYLHMLPGVGGGISGGRDCECIKLSKENSRVLGTDLLTKTSSAPEGYMEMSWSKETKTLNNNTITEKPSSDEYISMNFSNTKKSQPITIQSTPKTSAAPAYLHLNTNLEINSGGKRIRCDSKDSGIFPFSPSSPMKHFSTNLQSDSMDVNTLPRKCLVDGRSGTIKLSEEEDFSIDPDTPPPIQDPTKILNTETINPLLESLSNDYADMRLGSSHQIKKQRDNCGLAVIKSFDEPDYVNCNPAQKKSLTQIPLTKIDDNSGDYAFMNPSKSIKKSLLVQVNCNSTDKIPAYVGGGFKPIQTTTNEFNLINQKPLINRKNDSGGYEILQVRSDNSLMKKKRTLLSRPNSVNGEKISSKNSSSTSNLCNRPNSANSERLPAISSSSSSSTLCSSTSSTSTLCGSNSKCQSPSTRPQSFADSGSSRPESVSSITDSNHIISRPPSVSSERELHYASLDLPPSKMETDEQQQTGELINSSSANTSPNISGGSTSQQQPAFTYAQIDFVKSEGLKNQTKVNN